MEMSALNTLLEPVDGTGFLGYPDTGARAPYYVIRPMVTTPGDLALCGQSLTWDFQLGVYCCGASVEASYNLALAVMRALQGKRVDDSTLSCTMGYVGAQQESHYETQVTVQIDQGAL